MTQRLLVAWLAVLFLGPGCSSVLAWQQTAAEPSPQVKTEIPYRDGTVVLISDFQERITRSRYRASGHVHITFQEMLITCDEAEYDEESRAGTAKGNIRFSHERQWFSCTRAEFNFEEQTGVFYEATGFTDQEFLIRGETVVKTGRDTYRVERGFVSSCQEKRPKWEFGTRKANIRVDHTARLHHMLFKVKGVPLLYLPYLVVPMEKKERSSGLVPFHMGNSNSKGRVFSEGWFQTLGRSADAMIYGDYFSLRGLAIGGIFRARPNPQTRVFIEAYGINDKLDQGGAQVFVDAVSRLPADFRLVAHANVTTNFKFRQAFSDTFRAATSPQEESVVFLTQNRDSFSANFTFQRQEVFYPSRSVVIRESPTLEYFSLGKPIPRLPLIFYLRSSVDGLSRTDALIETPKIVQRFDVFPSIALRLPSLAGFSVMPSVGVRDTFYGAGIAYGPEPAAVTEHLNRKYFDVEVDVRTPTLEREFRASSGDPIKHVVEPTLRYRMISGIGDQLENIIRFDAQDPIADTNEVEYGVANRIFRNRRTSTGSVQPYEFMSFTITQKQYFDPTFGGAFKEGQANIFYPLYTLTGFATSSIARNFAPTNVVARVTPAPGITFDARADFDTKLDRLLDASITTLWHQERVFIAGTYFKTNQLDRGTFESNQIQGQFGWGRLDRGLSLSVTISYDIFSSRLLNSHTRLMYFWDCCGVALDYQKYDVGIRAENRLTFSFSLKGIGSFGNLKRPESLFQ
ncbi:MAG: Organic solvent tolerance protein OstA [Acidobacteria bacterium]|nr:Organic solvent tolerance protein OstA [Acidobacteriota bacterium]